MTLVLPLLLLLTVTAPQQVDCSPPADAPFTLNDAAPCLRSAAYRSAIEAKAVGGNASAASLLVDYYLDGAGEDKGLALKWFRQYIRDGGPPSAMYAQLLLETKDVKDALEAKAILGAMSDAGDLVASEVFGDYLASIGQEDGAIRQYILGAISGRASSMEKLSIALSKRDGDLSKRLAIYWFLETSKHFKAGTYKQAELVEMAKSVAVGAGINISEFQECLTQGTDKPAH